MHPWRGVPIAATCENGRPNLLLRLLLRPTQQDSASMLSISPRILHDCARNLNRLGKPKQAHNYNKVNGDTEAGQQKDADEDDGECMLVVIGATPEGKKERIVFQVGVRESAQLARTAGRGEKPWAQDRPGNSRR
jgi:hypothetical protein